MKKLTRFCSTEFGRDEKFKEISQQPLTQDTICGIMIVDNLIVGF